MKDLNLSISHIMTEDLVTVKPNTIMTGIDKIFKENTFRHLPVLDDNQNAIGIISKSDYNTLLNHFTLKKAAEYERANQRYFRALLAKEVMTKDPISFNQKTPIIDVIHLFLKNKISSVIITNDQRTCIGICTPIDVLKWISDQ